MKKAKTTPLKPVNILTILTAFGITTVLAHSRLLLEAERVLLGVLYAIPERYDIITLNITHFGSLATLYSAVLVTFILGFRKLSVTLLASGMFAYLSAGFIKEIVMRPRPAVLWAEFSAREWGPASFGYPSGHAAVITAIAFTLWPYVNRGYRLWLVVIAIVVALSRVVLGVHLPLDIVGGALLGVLGGCVGRYVIEKTKIKD